MLTEAEKNARYECWKSIVETCAKCGKTRSEGHKITLHYKNGAKCEAKSPWNWRVETQRDKTVGLCKFCKPSKEESEAQRTQYFAVGAKPTPIPSVYDPEGAKLDWFNNAVIKLGHEILEVFGEPITVVDMITRLKESRETLRQWRDKQNTLASKE